MILEEDMAQKLRKELKELSEKNGEEKILEFLQQNLDELLKDEINHEEPP